MRTSSHRALLVMAGAASLVAGAVAGFAWPDEAAAALHEGLALVAARDELLLFHLVVLGLAAWGFVAGLLEIDRGEAPIARPHRTRLGGFCAGLAATLALVWILELRSGLRRAGPPALPAATTAFVAAAVVALLMAARHACAAARRAMTAGPLPRARARRVRRHRG